MHDTANRFAENQHIMTQTFGAKKKRGRPTKQEVKMREEAAAHAMAVSNHQRQNRFMISRDMTAERHVKRSLSKSKSMDRDIPIKQELKQSLSPLPSLKQVENQIRISNGARELVQVALTEFICFITSDIIEDVREQQRVAIKDQDILESMDKLGFDHYIPCLEALVKRLNMTTQTDHSSPGMMNTYEYDGSAVNGLQTKSEKPHSYYVYQQQPNLK